jgi:hypothetical protein
MSIVHYYLSKQQTALSTYLCVYECIITYQNNRLQPTVCASALLPMKTTDYIVHIFVCASTLLPIKTTEYVLNILYVCTSTLLPFKTKDYIIHLLTLIPIKTTTTFSTYSMYIIIYYRSKQQTTLHLCHQGSCNVVEVYLDLLSISKC